MASGIRALIVDDEEAARRGIRLLLDDDPDVEIVGEAASADETVEMVRQEKPDLLFLDIQLGEQDGLTVLRELEGESRPVVVLTSECERHAAQAFEHHAVDYLLRPFSDERFGRAVERARSRLRESETQDGRRQGRDPRRIMVRSSSKIHFVSVDRIDWIEAAGDYVRLHLGDRSHLHRETMYRLARRLDPVEFVRIHRSAIVRLDRIDAVRFDERGGPHVVLADGTEHSLSRSGRRRLEEALGEDL